MTEFQTNAIVDALVRDNLIFLEERGLTITEKGAELAIKVVQDWYYRAMNGEADGNVYKELKGDAFKMFAKMVIEEMKGPGVLIEHYAEKAGYRKFGEI